MKIQGKSQAKARTKCWKYNEKKEAINAYKVWGKKKFMGKEFMGLIRSTFLIKDKKIIKNWRSVRVKGHAQEVLDFIENF